MEKPLAAQDRISFTRPCLSSSLNTCESVVPLSLLLGKMSTRCGDAEADTGQKVEAAPRSTLQNLSDEPNEEEICDIEERFTRRPKPTDIQLELYLRKCNDLKITPVGAFVRNLTCPVLNIPNYCLGPTGALALSVPLSLNLHITHLNLEGNHIKGAGAKHLRQCLEENSTITHLNLNDNELGSEGAEALGRVLLENSVLNSVSLAGNKFKDGDAIHFSKVLLERRPLAEFDLSRNELGEAAASQFGEALVNNEYLESFDLSWNNIRTRGGVALMQGLKENMYLKRLLLSRNGLGDAGCAAAGSALASNKSLLVLDLAGNRITNKGLLVLADYLKQNDSLQTLKLGDNMATGQGVQAVGEAVLRSSESAISLLDFTNINVFDILVKEIKELEQSRPIKLIHGVVTRPTVPLVELEKQFIREIQEAAANKVAVTHLASNKTFAEQGKRSSKQLKTREKGRKAKEKKERRNP